MFFQINIGIKMSLLKSLLFDAPCMFSASTGSLTAESHRLVPVHQSRVVHQVSQSMSEGWVWEYENVLGFFLFFFKNNVFACGSCVKACMRHAYLGTEPAVCMQHAHESHAVLCCVVCRKTPVLAADSCAPIQ